jgi:hypothetical protein
VKQGLKQAQKNGADAQPGHGAQQPAQVVACRTADGVQGIADFAFEPASVQAMVGLQVANGGLDGLATA